MSKTTRIYEVQVPNTRMDMPANSGCKVHLVDAASQQAAFAHIAKRHVGEVSLPSTRRVAELMGGGVKVELANE